MLLESCYRGFVVVVLVLMCCDFVFCGPYDVNLTDYTGSREKGYRKIHQRHRNRKPTSSPTEAPMETPLEGENMEPRLPKLFSFHALDEDLTIDLEFAVPFIHVPVKKSIQKTNAAVKSLVNLNTPALVLAGLLAGGSLIFGLIFHSYVGKSTIPGFKRTSRIADNISNVLDPFKLIQRSADGEKIEIAFGSIIQTVEDNFNKNNVDITACIQKSICAYVKRSAEHVRSGSATSTNKIIDGLVSSEWLLQYLEGSAVRDAIDSGIVGNSNCDYKYPTCQWSHPEKHLVNMMFGFVKNIPAVKNIWS